MPIDTLIQMAHAKGWNLVRQTGKTYVFRRVSQSFEVTTGLIKHGANSIPSAANSDRVVSIYHRGKLHQSAGWNGQSDFTTESTFRAKVMEIVNS